MRTLAIGLLALTGHMSVYSDCSWDDEDCQWSRENASLSLQAGQTADIHQVSETFGHLVGREIKAQELDLNVDDVILGLRAALAGRRAPMTEQEYVEVIERLKNRDFQQAAETNLALANAFMSSNAKKPGVVELVPSKIQYRTLQPGNGAVVKADAAPLMRYSGHYLDGTLFGSSDEVGGPIAIPIAQMISGFREGVKGMKEGETRRLFIHPDYAYGAISEIPPNSLLIFKVEVIRADGSQAPTASEPRKPERYERPVSQSALTRSKPTGTYDNASWDLNFDDEGEREDKQFSKRPLKLRPAT
jgi:FKBP-type peptidyl-prolyl cis-trans isomerase